MKIENNDLRQKLDILMEKNENTGS